MIPAGTLSKRRGGVILFFLGLMLLGSAPTAFGESGSVEYSFGSSLSQNQSNYTLFYSVPHVVQAGARANLTLYVYVTELSGWKVQSQRQVLRVIVNTATKSVATVETQNNFVLYQGARWGPFNVTLDLNDSQMGLSPGQVANATLYANLIVYEQYDNPAYPFLEDDGATLKLTTVQLAATPGAASASGDRLFTSIAVGAAVVVVLTGTAFFTSRRRKATEQRAGLTQ